MTNISEDLERLQKLRDSGMLSEDEYELERLRREPLKERSSFKAAIAGAGVTAAVCAGAIWFMSPSDESSVEELGTKKPIVEASTDENLKPMDPKEKLIHAFEVATGKPGPFSEKVGSDRYQVTPIRLLDLPFGPVLLAKREIKDGCHGCVGYIGIYYLKEEAGKLTLQSSHPEAVSGWGWGNAPTDWQVLSKFTQNPAIVSKGSYTGQGITMSSMSIVELTASGPKASDLISTGFDNEGQVDPGDPGSCLLHGEVANIVKDKSFDMIVSGAQTGVDRYRKVGGKFVAQGKRNWESPCPQPGYDEPEFEIDQGNEGSENY